jgi:putative toxin-antitoxin system antitoxin component (TIGR02293 family)
MGLYLSHMKTARATVPVSGFLASGLDLASGRSTSIAKKYPARPTHAEIKVGYATKLVVKLAGKLGIPAADMAKRIGVSRSTFHRMLRDNVLLTGHESDAFARHSTLFTQAVAVFDGDEQAARQWLEAPQIGLGGAVPLDLAQTTFGYREAEKLLTRIDHGVYA